MGMRPKQPTSKREREKNVIAVIRVEASERTIIATSEFTHTLSLFVALSLSYTHTHTAGKYATIGIYEPAMFEHQLD